MILVGTDGSVPALAAERIAIELATATGDSLLFVTVWRELHGDFGLPLRTLIPDVVDIERDWAKETVDAAAERAQEAGVEAEVETRHGRPAEEICAAASEREARMIAVGSSGWGAVTRTLLGTVSGQVLHHAPCPVLVVGGDAGGQQAAP
jgi:nucleotide-binding universal stress UspA family protein